MTKKNAIDEFRKLTPQEILAFPQGLYDDSELLAAFTELKDEPERATAILELILRSPDHSEEIDYSQIYQDVIENYKADEPAKALGWAYARLVWGEQHDPGDEQRFYDYREIAEVYLGLGDLNTGLALYLRSLRMDPGDLWAYNTLGLVLPDFGLAELALPALKCGLSLVKHPDFESLQDQLQQLYEEAQDFFQRNDPPSRLGQVDPALLAAFQAQLAAPAPTSPDDRLTVPYLPPVTELLAAGSQLDQDLRTRILAEGKLIASELIHLAFDPDLQDTPAPAQAIALLRELRSTMIDEFTEISSWLERADGNWRIIGKTDLLGKTGGFTHAELENYASEPRYAFGVRLAAFESLVKRAEKFPEFRDEVIALARTLLTRPQAYEASEEEMLGFVISMALDLDARELIPEVKAAFEEDRVDPMVIGMDYVYKEWELGPTPSARPRRDGLDLLLKCVACGRQRHHFVHYVLVDTVTLEAQREGQEFVYPAYIMDHEIVCKCGAIDRYDLTHHAFIRLTDERHRDKLIESMVSPGVQVEDFKPHPRVFFFEAAALGERMHPFKGIEEYRRRIALKPGDARLHIGLGNILRLLFRYEQALDEYHFAYELAPSDLHVLVTCALGEHDLGNKDAARQMYEKIVALESAAGRGPFSRHVSDECKVAVQGLYALRRGKLSSWEVPIYNAQGKPLPVLRPTPPHKEKGDEKPPFSAKKKRHRWR
ncbi:MAG: hypothetical protein AB1894_20380 [Chloroflexota bacterium]